MSTSVKPYKDSAKGKKEQVTEMFDNISEEYDGLNRKITYGIDVKWRKRLIQKVANLKPKTVLDIATGTGDLAILAAQMTEAQEIIGADISEGMMQVGRKKVEALGLSQRVQMKTGDSENLPFDNDYFDVVTVAFGVRNFENLDKGLQEILRVLKPNGALYILETSQPKNAIIRLFYRLHSNVVLPFFGKLFSKDPKAYQYLSKSAQKFPHGQEFNNIMTKNGFIKVQDFPQFFGAASIYEGFKVN
jgi:demethylmenaquinone methyltransferase/2-methoxy-6-polyprenyl-1,4-benzoquinol methylase